MVSKAEREGLTTQLRAIRAFQDEIASQNAEQMLENADKVS